LGVLSIDRCRISTSGETFHNVASVPANRKTDIRFSSQMDTTKMHAAQRESIERTTTLGRWPANILLTDDAAQRLNEQSGVSVSVSGGTRGSTQIWGNAGAVQGRNGYTDGGGASRYFKRVSEC
jgi:hypothetical protein